jgi:NAD-dependent deacetylase
MRPKRVVVLSGAGMSAGSGLRTFRDNNGLWEDHRVEDVATAEAWRRDRALVLRFYNERRKALLSAEPNDGHRIIAGWEKEHRVTVVTQNVDDLHERAGSADVIHLHGELMKSRSTKDPTLVYPMHGWELKEGDLCEKGSQLRPHIVWFGEDVPLMSSAQEVVSAADVLVVVGTSLQVYPAASLAFCARPGALCILVDPRPAAVSGFRIFGESASAGLARVTREVLRSGEY